jgi:protein TonB
VVTTITVNYSFGDSGKTQARPGDLKNLSEVPRKIGGDVLAPKLISSIEPGFTPEGRKAKVSGTVLVNFVVDEHGRPQNVHVLRGLGIGPDGKIDPKLKKAAREAAGGMNKNAVDAVSQYKFEPATEGGRPVPVDLNVEVNFKIF